MIVNIDLDNTFLDFDRGWCELHNEMRELYGYRADLPPARPRTPQEYGTIHELTGHTSMGEFWQWFAANGGWDRVPPMPDAVEAAVRLYDLGCRIRFVTARSHHTYSATASTLERLLGGKVLYTLVYKSDKARLVSDPAREIWFEDHAPTLEALAEVGVRNLYKLAWPWNADAPGTEITWAEVAGWEGL